MELDITKPKKLVFGISIANVDVTNVKGTFVLFLDNSFNLGFSTSVENGKLSVIIPSLEKFNIIEGEYESELWVVANRDYFTIPWSEKILITKSIKVDTKVIKESDEEPYVLVTKPIVIKE